VVPVHKLDISGDGFPDLFLLCYVVRSEVRVPAQCWMVNSLPHWIHTKCFRYSAYQGEWTDIIPYRVAWLACIIEMANGIQSVAVFPSKSSYCMDLGKVHGRFLW